MTLCPYAAQIVVHGERRKYCTALIALDPESLRQWAQSRGLSGTHAALVARPEVVALVSGYVDQLNVGLNRWETIKRFSLLERELTVADGELTPSLKVRRKIVERAYRDRLDAMYQ